MNTLNKDEGQIPLLVGLSVLRTGDDTLPGHYDIEQKVWMIDEGNGPKPIVEVAGRLAELSTMTEVKSERADPSPMAFLEAITITKAKAEGHDVSGCSLMYLLQLVTKTSIRQERDD